MPIIFDENKKIFMLHTPNTTYAFGLMKDNFLVHLYWGKRIDEFGEIEKILPFCGRAFSTASYGFEREYSNDTLPMEFPTYGNVDLRIPAFAAEYSDGSTVTKLDYAGHRIYCGKKKLQGLPAVYTEDECEAQSLEIELHDKLTGLCVILQYTVFTDFDAITRSVKLINNGTEKIKIKNIMSASVDMQGSDYEMLHLWGAWGKERKIERNTLLHGRMEIDSKRGSSSHHHNPFVCMVGKNTTETMGDAYGMSLVYSGNFVAGAEVDAYNTTRAYIGINPFQFGYNLESGTEFQSPEAVLVYSSNGLGEMSRTYHKLYRTRLCRGKWRDKTRPVLVNNWEATYFDFNEEKILAIAEKAKEIGIDLVVLDDGWFGKRNIDNCSLGDWYVNYDKLPCGIDGLAEKINAMGLKFGLWFEPEMVSPDSDLYRAHPDWCIHVKNRDRSEERWQLILDLSRDDVCEYIINAVNNVLDSANIEYVKWDMNRNMSEIGSALLAAENQCELCHRYILGLYRVLEEIVFSHPDILFESCSGGGGRFDPGMLYYMPQIWTSDDTDAIERLYIQYGTSIVYPASVMGAHVSAVPNHQVPNRVTPISTRGNVAMSGGAFGYEMDLSKMSEEDICAAKEQVKQYKQLSAVVQKGDMYRLLSPYEGNTTAWEFVSEDGEYVVVMYANILGEVNGAFTNIRLQGIDDKSIYTDEKTGEQFSGEFLKNMGIYRRNLTDFTSELIVYKKQK